MLKNANPRKGLSVRVESVTGKKKRNEMLLFPLQRILWVLHYFATHGVVRDQGYKEKGEETDSGGRGKRDTGEGAEAGPEHSATTGLCRPEMTKRPEVVLAPR